MVAPSEAILQDAFLPAVPGIPGDPSLQDRADSSFIHHEEQHSNLSFIPFPPQMPFTGGYSSHHAPAALQEVGAERAPRAATAAHQTNEKTNICFIGVMAVSTGKERAWSAEHPPSTPSASNVTACTSYSRQSLEALLSSLEVQHTELSSALGLVTLRDSWPQPFYLCPQKTRAKTHHTPAHPSCTWGARRSPAGCPPAWGTSGLCSVLCRVLFPPLPPAQNGPAAPETALRFS